MNINTNVADGVCVQHITRRELRDGRCKSPRFFSIPERYILLESIIETFTTLPGYIY